LDCGFKEFFNFKKIIKMKERSDIHKFSIFNLQFSIINSCLSGLVTFLSESGIKRYLWLGVLISLILFSGSSLAMDCHLGEKYYIQAKSATDPVRITEWLHRSIAVCPNFNAWYMLGLLYKNQGQINEAIDAFDQAGGKARTSKLESLALARQGELLAQTGQFFQALRALRRPNDFTPNRHRIGWKNPLKMPESNPVASLCRLKKLPHSWKSAHKAAETGGLPSGPG
jgi:tetratricopeptide (TPR) repeat protein